MTDEIINLPSEATTIEFHLVTLFEKLEALKNDNKASSVNTAKLPVRVEIRTLEFWKSVISECLASFIYVFVVCGAAAGAGAGAPIPSVLLATALAAGFAMTSLTQCFGHISGAQINPAVTIAMGITKNISVLRTAMFVMAQCGGAIAGAAFLYGVTVPQYQGNNFSIEKVISFTYSVSEAAVEKLGIELILSFVVVFSYFVSMDAKRRWMGTSALTIGATYSACSFVSMPYLNPARSLGPSFVLHKWTNHWVYWVGPIIGGIIAGLTYEYIFNSRRNKKQKTQSESDSSSIQSDEDTYDDLDKPSAAAPKFHGSTYNTYRPSAGATNAPPGYCPSLTSASLYSAPPAKLERVESLYGGTKSLYCKSPPLTRANLNRSQSVYTKSNSAINRGELLPKAGPLVPAQSLYPMRLNQQNHVQNQNLQNQMQQRSESVYGVRGVTPGTARTNEYSCNTAERTIYSNRSNNNGGSVYGTRNENTRATIEGRPPPPRPSSQLLTTSNSSSYHHNSAQQHSPNSQY